MQGMRVQIHVFSHGSSWVKALTSFSVLVAKVNHLLEEIYQLLGVGVHSQRGKSGVQLHYSFPACSTLCWRASFVSALLQMKSQRRSLPYCFPPCSSSIHRLMEE